MPYDDERDLRSLLRDAHAALDPPPPEFAATLAAVRRRAERLRASRRGALRVAAAAAALVIVLAASIHLGRPRPTEPDTTEALRTVEALSGWRAPTDFLDRLPGTELLEDPPQFDSAGELLRSLSTALASAAGAENSAPGGLR